MPGLFQSLYDSGIGGVLRKPIKQATGLSDLQLAGLAAAAVAAPYAIPAMTAGGATAGAGAASGATGAAAPTAGASAGGMGGMSGLLSSASTGMNIANQAHQMAQGQPVQAGQLPQRQGPDMSGLLSAQTQQQSAFDADRQRRLQQQQMVMQGLLGGRNGIA